MIKIQKALDLLAENPNYEPNSIDLEMVTIINSLKDPDFKKQISANQKKDQFYDYKSESKYVAEYNEDSSWFYVFCKKNIRNIDLLLKVHKNQELAKEILDDIISQYSKKEYLEELFNNNIIENKMKGNYQLSIANKNILDNFEYIEDDLIKVKNVVFDREYNLPFYRLNNENILNSKEFSGIKKRFILNLSDLYVSFYNLDSFDQKRDYDKFYDWVEKSISSVYFTPVCYEYIVGSKSINFMIVKELSETIHSQISFSLSKKADRKEKIKKITFDAVWLLFKQISGISTVESLKELVDQIDELKEVSDLMTDSAELQAISYKEKVSILYDEFTKSNHPTFKQFFITFFQQAISNLFKEWGVEIPKQNIEAAYTFFITNVVKSNVTIDKEVESQSKSYKDKDLFYIECMINQRFMDKKEELFNNLY